MCTAAACLGLALAAGAAAQSRADKLRETFLVFGTVFTGRGQLLPGAEIGVRRGDEKKYRWRAVADRRGEFGIRVPMGAEYEVRVRAKGFAEETRKVDARQGSREDLTFRLSLPAEKPRQGEPK